MAGPAPCNCIAYPCECAGDIKKIDPLPMPYEPVMGTKITGTTPLDPVKTLNPQPPVPIVNNYYLTGGSGQPVAPAIGNAADASSGTIFGFKPITVLIAAAAGLWLLSSMDGKK